MARFRPPGDCPVCGEFVPAGAKACRECGSCERTGWNEEADYDGLDLPDEAFEDEPRRPGRDGNLMQRVWWIAAVVLVLVTIWYWFLGRL
ncbi:hypothetical protein AYO41_01175 [Verrucomicrobia bacterium SCGC AG-212-E04]|nr:hypothetical protein AYO41_01175 [Verrucomicrobia bacterium SCGC AG-212-E04]